MSIKKGRGFKPIINNRKECTLCHEIKDLSEYYEFSQNGKSYFYSRCKKCSISDGLKSNRKRALERAPFIKRYSQVEANEMIALQLKEERIRIRSMLDNSPSGKPYGYQVIKLCEYLDQFLPQINIT